jgi:hypothetical protein
MAPADLRALLLANPFAPFRIVTSDGTVYEVRHPDLCMVGLASALVGYPSPRQEGVYERYDVVSMRHIVRLEPQEQPVPQDNGEG